jgi:hypothetical protein
VRDRADQHRRSVRTGGQQLLQALQPGGNHRIWARPPKALDADQITGGESVGSRQHLAGSDPDQCTERGQLGIGRTTPAATVRDPRSGRRSPAALSRACPA